jgi:ADP-L-glycero-D-manno-heptose 6-epimerase
VDCEVADYYDKEDFLDRVLAGIFEGAIDAVFHQGACSDTMETDGRYMMDNNYRYSLALLDFCQDDEVPFIYASSAAVYGGGRIFREEREHEAPLNVYGYSKFLFDQIVRRRLDDAGAQIAGFRYFNVYGRNEAHKGRMASVAWHFYNQYRADGRVKLFEGTDGYADGEQHRDFVSVEDVVKVNLHFFDNPRQSGIFNVGTGRAQSFNDVAVATLNACRRAEGKPPASLDELKALGAIEYVSFPEALRGKYQSYTEADIGALRESGYQTPFLSVDEGVERYVDELLRREANV